MSILWFILIGLVAGWIAGQIMKTASSSWLQDLIVGVIGSLLGGLLFTLIGLSSNGLIGSLVTSTIGAMAFIAGIRAIDRRRLL